MSEQDRHTRFVKLARIALPIVALVVASFIFLFEREDALRDATFVVTDKIKEAALNQKVTNPKFSGITRDGDAFTITAIEALPNQPKEDQLELVKPDIDVETDSGVAIKTIAQTGRLDFNMRRAELSGNVLLSASNGISAQSDYIVFDLDSGTLESPGKIKAEAQIGNIVAGNMRANRAIVEEETAEDSIIDFAGGVRVLYRPSGRYKE